MRQNIKYSLRVWLTGVILSPVLFAFVMIVTKGGMVSYTTPLDDLCIFIGYGLLAGAIFSLPGLLILWLAVTLLGNADMTIPGKKIILILLALIVMILTFYFAPQGEIPIIDPIGIRLFLSYFVIIGGAIIYYNLEKKVAG